MQEPINKIDAVITWVDGGDKNFIKLKNKYSLRQKNNLYSSEEFGDYRYTQNSELQFLLKY